MRVIKLIMFIVNNNVALMRHRLLSTENNSVFVILMFEIQTNLLTNKTGP